jgi:RNA recognition motif-containing protein
MPQLFFSNIPCDCQDSELRSWIESHGFDVDSLRVVRDQVAGVSPAFGYVTLRGRADRMAAIKALDGQDLKGRRLQVAKDWRDERRCG